MYSISRITTWTGITLKSGLIGRWRQVVTSHTWVARLEILLTRVKICFTEISGVAILTDTRENIESVVTAVIIIIIFFLDGSANSLVLTCADVDNRTQDCVDGSISYYEFYVNLRQNKENKKLAFAYLHCYSRFLRWLKTVSSTFQGVDFDGSLLPLFIS